MYETARKARETQNGAVRKEHDCNNYADCDGKLRNQAKAEKKKKS